MTKEERRIIAEKHFAETQKERFEETVNSVRMTTVVNDENAVTHTPSTYKPFIEVKNSTTENAILNFGGNVGVLNFASYTRPGGGFIKGSIAQEEALCHVSNLYDIIKRFDFLYKENFERSDCKTGLYRNWGLYSPNVWFEINGYECFANVFTCPCPNYTKWLENGDGDEMMYCETLRSRIRFILDTFMNNGDKNIILGAYGCGVFGNNPTMVANIFKELLNSGSYNFNRVTFAVNGGENYNVFKSVFDEQ